jgi:drug/metabolite transporter (DMT)-like permease
MATIDTVGQHSVDDIRRSWTAAKASIAGVLAIILPLTFRAKRPHRDSLGALFVVALGVVMGFPQLTALALRHVTSAHAIVFVGLLPVTTALFAVVTGGERPRPAFWLFSGSTAFHSSTNCVTR